MMKAAVYTKFHGPIEIKSTPIPQIPADGVLIKIMATGVCRSDWHGWSGHDDDIKSHGLPFTPGHEFSGILVQLGSSLLLNNNNNANNNNKLKVGSRVVAPFILSCGSCNECIRNRSTICVSQNQPGFTMQGSFAEYIAIPRAQRNVYVLPSLVSFVEAAALGCRFTTAYRAVVQQGLQLTTMTTNMNDNKNNLTVAVFGCGGLGLSCIMICKATNAFSTVIAVDVSNAALDKAKEIGATHVIRASKSDPQVVRDGVMNVTHRIGADVTIDAAGFVATCEDAVWCTRRGGRMVQVGLPIGGNGQPQKTPQIPMGRVAGWEIEIFGSHGFDASMDMYPLLDLVACRRLQPGKLVNRRVSLEEGVQTLMDMDHISPLGITMITEFDSDSSGGGESHDGGQQGLRSSL